MHGETSIKLALVCCGVCMHVCVYHYYRLMLQMNNILYKLGVVQSADGRFLSRLPAKWWLGE